jgi:repressor LexA
MKKSGTGKMKRVKLSERQKKMLVFIESFLHQHGYPPTIREIGEAVQIGSTSVVNYNLNKLVKAGLIERAPDVSRGLRLVDGFSVSDVQVVNQGVNITRVPVVGQIVASKPVPLPGEDFGYHFDEDDMIDVPTQLLGKWATSEQIYALRVRGNSMIDALVRDRDVVILNKQETAENGDMVAVWLRDTGETTLKYFYHEGTQVRLQPANTTMEPIYVDARQVHVQGKVLAVLRSI